MSLISRAPSWFFESLATQKISADKMKVRQTDKSMKYYSNSKKNKIIGYMLFIICSAEDQTIEIPHCLLLKVNIIGEILFADVFIPAHSV